jgi:hypothetical protein
MTRKLKSKTLSSTATPISEQASAYALKQTIAQTPSANKMRHRFTI